MTAGGDDGKDSLPPAKFSKAEILENIARARARHQARQADAEARQAEAVAARAAAARAAAEAEAWEAMGEHSEEGGWFLPLSTEVDESCTGNSLQLVLRIVETTFVDMPIYLQLPKLGRLRSRLSQGLAQPPRSLKRLSHLQPRVPPPPDVSSRPLHLTAGAAPPWGMQRRLHRRLLRQTCLPLTAPILPWVLLMGGLGKLLPLRLRVRRAPGGLQSHR